MCFPDFYHIVTSIDASRGGCWHAFAGMLDYIAAGRVGRGESIVFLHTGGQPALFAYDKEILEIEA